ncbi:PKHD-type hydroxylase ASG34_06000 [Novimethylophilus kurashikiensis]|uniref:PKHD-type hydroxylase ASG34_06000 n=1 Tax=Novimethylophilus kurashikiensis TaxID=1825523 RepID=A0A2R5F8M3_9PROT|nr:cyclic-phosphate processing receiver domain-containing protein [Novimethylophilus kurashikiensis]GBG14385.1 PKHD-type hydroxylase ASG34_06000 [Novimethylophilus kurashikiensis]
MFLFLDDSRPAPVGATVCRSAKEAIKLLATEHVRQISFDSDLGDGGSPYEVAAEILKSSGIYGKTVPHWCIHDRSNPVVARNIRSTMLSAERRYAMSNPNDPKRRNTPSCRGIVVALKPGRVGSQRYL